MFSISCLICHAESKTGYCPLSAMDRGFFIFSALRLEGFFYFFKKQASYYYGVVVEKKVKFAMTGLFQNPVILRGCSWDSKYGIEVCDVVSEPRNSTGL